jgi:DNA-binding response OmpR family regulator
MAERTQWAGQGELCIAVVEDDLALGQQLVDVLHQAELGAQWFKRGRDFLEACAQPSAFGAALLDMRLPDMTGLAVLAALENRAPPVVMLTGMTEESGLIKAFELGVHDYLFKPFRPAELIARLKGLVRRTSAQPDATDRATTESLALAQHPGHDQLTEKERGCAELLLGQLGKTVSRETLRRQVWRGHQAVSSRTIDTHVCRVRAKLGLNRDGGFELNAVYGVGYRLQKLA